MSYYISKQCSSEGDGSKQHPFKSVSDLFKSLKISCDTKIDFKIIIENEGEYTEISKAQLKKEMKNIKANEKKAAHVGSKTTDKEADKGLFSTISLDTTLAEAPLTPICQLKELRNVRVGVLGWVAHIRKQSKKLWFITLRDPPAFLQCVFENDLCKTKEASILNCESLVMVYGVVLELPKENTAEGGHELRVDYWELIGKSPSGGIESVINKDSNVDVLFDNRDLMMRGETASRIQNIKSETLMDMIYYYRSNKLKLVDLPEIVQNVCEGGSTLFKLDYYGGEAFLTQSNQLYLETMLPVTGDSFVVGKSFRAEKSRTRRHLSEYKHIEAEYKNITFDGLLDRIEDLLVSVSHSVLENNSDLLLKVHPDFKPLEKPFRRMTYRDALVFLTENNIRKPDGSLYEFGDDIPEAAERSILAIIDEPLMLTRFPATLKAFYMSRCADDNLLTESVDVLLPGVGEVVGGSMRITDYDELISACKREGLELKNYGFYTNQRLYGSVKHGGYGLGFERFMTWVCGREHIRDVCTYPRSMDRCYP